MSEREKTARLRRLLRRRLLGGNGGNGDAWAYFEEVRNGTGFAKQERTADALAMSLWPSRGLELHGFEVKAFRSDWLRELRQPEKADDFVRHCDRWWLVSEPDVVEDGELPPTWGHLVRKGNKLVQVTAAPKLNPEPIDKPLLAAILRRAARQTEATPEEVAEAVKAERERQEARIEALRERIRAFEREAGLPLESPWPAQYGPAEVGKAVRLYLRGEAEVESAEQRLRRLAEQAENIAQRIRGYLGEEAA